MRAVQVLVAASVLCFLSQVSVAETAVSGQLTIEGATVTPANGVAMWDVSTAAWDKGKRVLKVILCDTPLTTEGVNQALDVEDAIRQQIDGDFIILSLNEEKSLDNVYVFVGDGAKNYGFQRGSADLETLSKDRVAGRAATKGEEAVFDTTVEYNLSFAIDILPERTPGEALPAGGGAAGAAYLAYVKGLQEKNLELLLAHCPAPKAEYLQGMDEQWRGYELDSMKEMAPVEMKVTGGELFDGYAFLTVSGKDWAEDQVEGRVKMVADGETWRFETEDLEMVW